MLARIGKTLSTNVAIGGLALVVLGAGGAGATLTSGNSETPKPDKVQKVQTPDATETDGDAESEGGGTRPTDTHGYCVSQVAKTKPAAPTGTGPDKVNHGSLVREAAHACGKQERAAKAAKAGKAHGRGHGTGRPSTVTPGGTVSP